MLGLDKYRTGDIINFRVLSKSYKCVVLRHVKEEEPLLEYNPQKADEDMIVVLDQNKEYRFLRKYHLDYVTLLNRPTEKDFTQQTTLFQTNPGDIVKGHRDSPFYYVVIRQVNPHEKVEEIKDYFTSTKHCVLLKPGDSNIYITSGIDHNMFVYSPFDNQSATKANIFDSSMWNAECTVCSKPSYIGAGPMECSDPKCIVNKR